MKGSSTNLLNLKVVAVDIEIMSQISAISQKFKLEEEQLSMQKTVKKIIEEDINPFVDQWEAEGQYPAKQVDLEL